MNSLVDGWVNPDIMTQGIKEPGKVTESFDYWSNIWFQKILNSRLFPKIKKQFHVKVAHIALNHKHVQND